MIGSQVSWKWIGVIALVRLILHVVVADQYGFHRDEYLYLAQTEHLAWGFMEVPPALAFLGAGIRFFGDGIIWIKFIPALFGCAMIFMIAKMVADLGGKHWAQITAVLAFAVVPAFLRTHHLFQPVFLNQFMWTLLTFLVVRLLVTENKYYWYGIGATIGVGMLTKYTMAFPVAGLLSGVLLTPQRYWLSRKEPYLAALLALFILLPNIYWQYSHNWPIINHMNELRETQLVNVRPTFFLTMQFLMLFAASLLWSPGLISFFTKAQSKFRMIGWMYICMILLLLVLSGKPYYSLGMYPVLIAAGAVWWERILPSRNRIRVALPVVIVAISLPLVPYGLPVFSVEKMESYCRWMSDHAGLSAPLIWEDGVARHLPQDYADMFGWEEGVANLARQYHKLPPVLQSNCNLWGGSYGHAGALLYYADKYDLPRDITSFNGSFALWAKDEADFTCQLNLDDNLNLTSEYFGNVELVDSNSTSYARDPGYVIFRSEPLVDIPETWKSLVAGQKDQWRRK